MNFTGKNILKLITKNILINIKLSILKYSFILIIMENINEIEIKY